MSGKRVEAVNPAGELVSIPEDQALAASMQGYKITSPEARAEEALQAEYGGTGNATLAGLEGFARGATLGGSDWISSKVGGLAGSLAGPDIERATGQGVDAGVTDQTTYDLAQQEARTGLLGRQQANATSATLGEVGGAIGLGLLTGGLGTEALAAKGLAKYGATALGKAAVKAGAGALEGAAFGVAKAVDDDFLNDREITAERIALGAGDGALLGGVLAGGASLLGSGVKAAANKTSALLGGLKNKLVGRTAPEASAYTSVDALNAGAATGAESRINASLSASADDSLNLANKVELDSTIQQAVDEASRLSNSVDGEASAALDLAFEPVYEKMGALVSREVAATERTKAAQLFAQARASEGGYDRAREAAVRAIGDDADEFLKLRSKIDEAAGIAAKRRDAAALNGWGRPVKSDETIAAFDEFNSRLKSLSEEYGSSIDEGGGSAAIKQLLKRSENDQKRFAAALQRGDVGDAAMVLDDFKRSVDRVAATTKNPLVRTTLQGEQGIGGASDIMRRHLENEELFGTFAAKQKRVNPTWAESIRRESDQLLSGLTYNSGDASANIWKAQRKLNRESLNSLLGRLGDGAEGAAVEPREAAIRKWLRSSLIDAKNRAKAWGDDELLELANRMEEKVAAIETNMNAVALSRRDAEAWKALTKDIDVPGPVGWALKGSATVTQKLAGVAESLSQRSTSTTAAAKAVGTASANASRNMAVGATVDAQQQALAVAAAQAQRRAEVMASARQAAERGESRLEKAATGLLSKLTKAAERASKTASSVSDSVAIAGIILKPSEPGSYEKVIQHLMRIQDTTSEERRRLDERTAELALESPEHAQALNAQIQRTADFLVEKAGPSSVDVTKPFGHLSNPRHERAKAMALARYARAAQNPGGALERIAAGKHSREDIETLKTLYPRIWSRFGAKVRAQLASLKKPPSYQARLMLSQVLEQPMTAFESPSFQQAITESNGSASADVQKQRRQLSMLAQAGNGEAAGSDQTLARGE